MASAVANASNQKPKVEEHLAAIAVEGLPAIESRLRQLDCEWSRGRAAQLFLGCSTLGGSLLGLWDPRWGLGVTAVGGLLLIQNGASCRGLVNRLLSRFGWRTLAEREHERSMLKAIRGDFAAIPRVVDEEDRHAIDRMEGEGGPVDLPDNPRRVPVNREAVRELVDIVKRDCPEA